MDECERKMACPPAVPRSPFDGKGSGNPRRDVAGVTIYYALGRLELRRIADERKA